MRTINVNAAEIPLTSTSSKISFIFSLLSMIGILSFNSPRWNMLDILVWLSVPAVVVAALDVRKKDNRSKLLSFLALAIGGLILCCLILLLIIILTTDFSHIEL